MKKNKKSIHKCYYTWKNFDTDVYNLVRRIKYAKFKPKTIVGLARGGAIVGVKLSHLLHIPLLIMSVRSYSKGVQQNTMLINSTFTVPLQSPALVVDDVTDSGHTLSVIVSHLAGVGIETKTATLFHKEMSIFKPDWYLHKDNRWIVYPWER